jgi:hypothetical protein
VTARDAQRVLNEFHPRFTRPQYLEFVRSFATTETFELSLQGDR